MMASESVGWEQSGLSCHVAATSIFRHVNLIVGSCRFMLGQRPFFPKPSVTAQAEGWMSPDNAHCGDWWTKSCSSSSKLILTRCGGTYLTFRVPLFCVKDSKDIVWTYNIYIYIYVYILVCIGVCTLAEYNYVCLVLYYMITSYCVMLSYIVLYCVALYSIVLYFIISYYIVLEYITSYYTISDFIMLSYYIKIYHIISTYCLILHHNYNIQFKSYHIMACHVMFCYFTLYSYSYIHNLT